MNTKAIFAATILSALFAGTSAIAEDRDNLFEWELNATPVVTKVSYQAPVVSPDVETVLGGRK